MTYLAACYATTSLPVGSRGSRQSHAVENGRQGETEICIHSVPTPRRGRSRVASVGRVRPEDHHQHFRSNGITGDEDHVSEEETTARNDSVRQVDESACTASVEDSSGDLIWFAASDVAEYSSRFEGGYHVDASLSTITV